MLIEITMTTHLCELTLQRVVILNGSQGREHRTLLHVLHRHVHATSLVCQQEKNKAISYTAVFEEDTQTEGKKTRIISGKN